MSLSVPVAFIVFNRPELTQRVFNIIASARPPKLFVVADGPRAHHPEDADKCAATRSVIDSVDWDCEVLTNYAKVNLGCKLRVSSGLNWVFDHCEEAIILEDDCLPHLSFFPYCNELLTRFRFDQRVSVISGDNFQLGFSRTPYSYYFSRYVHIWGWATWRRAWQHYEITLNHWPTLRETSWLIDILGDPLAGEIWRDIFDRVHLGEIETWDYQWVFACWVQNSLAVVPSVNLVSNIGFSGDGTHTTGAASSVANLNTLELTFPLQHPPYVIRQREADEFEFNHEYMATISRCCRASVRRHAEKIARFLPKPLRWRVLAHLAKAALS